MKHLLAGVILLYLVALLVVTAVAPLTHIDPGPKITLGARPDLPHQPPDFSAISSIAERKQAFFDFMRPLVAHQNAYYRQERERLLAISAKLNAGQTLGWGERRKLGYWSGKFRLEPGLDVTAQLELLERRVHTIPEAMVLAQAAAESGWGQSRFAREANNYFGQWCYTPGCGLVPLRRDGKAKHEVRNFDSALAAVRAYFININSHKAYLPLRVKRLALEQNGEAVTGHELVGELGRYSQRGQTYIRELRQIIRGNELE